jgi:hypothetical protein
MKVSKLFVTSLFLTSILLAAPAFADTVTFIGATGPSIGGVNVAPYQIQDSAILGGATINVICDDFADHVSSGDTWTAQIETFTAAGMLSPGALFGSSNPAYDEAVYLYAEFLNGSADAGGVNYAIWGLFDPSVVTSSAYTPTDAAALLAAITPTELNNFNYSSFLVITPTSLGSTGEPPQEFIYQTPEPSSLLLLSSGVFGLGFMKRKVFQS